jgi:hypothetical protein
VQHNAVSLSLVSFTLRVVIKTLVLGAVMLSIAIYGVILSVSIYSIILGVAMLNVQIILNVARDLYNILPNLPKYLTLKLNLKNYKFFYIWI